MDFEQKATAAIIDIISTTSRLKSFINSNDKEPSFDGNIYIYDNDEYQKKNLKRVSVQIKGKGVQAKPKATIKYPISAVDLDIFMRNGGTMFFVVYIDKATGATKQIYYSALLPFKIKEILKLNQNNTGNISVNFSKFPTNLKDITDLFLWFHTQSNKQISFIEKDTPSINDLQEKGVLESLSVSFMGSNNEKGFNEFPKILDGKEMYLYANIKDGVAPIPVDYYSQVSQIQMSCIEESPVGVNGELYYLNFGKTITAEKIVFRIGSSVTISFPNIDESDEKKDFKVTISVQIKGTLKQRIKSLEFLIAMFEAKSFEIGKLKLPANFPEEELKKLNASEYPDALESHKRILNALEKLNIKKDISLDNFTKNDYWKLNSLVGAIEDEAPIYNVEGDLPWLVNLDFGELHLLMICKKQDDGAYKIWDFFNKQMDVYYLGKNKEKLPTSQYAILKEDAFLTVDNLNLQSIVNDFKRMESHKYIAENGNMVMLEILKAYDKENKIDLLDTAKQLFEWLETIDHSLSSEIMLINKLQIALRERDLTFAEKQELSKIAVDSDEITCKIGAFILLNEQDEAEKLIQEMPVKEKEDFMSYPIFKFYTKPKEDQNNGQA